MDTLMKAKNTIQRTVNRTANSILDVPTTFRSSNAFDRNEDDDFVGFEDIDIAAEQELLKQSLIDLDLVEYVDSRCAEDSVDNVFEDDVDVAPEDVAQDDEERRDEEPTSTPRTHFPLPRTASNDVICACLDHSHSVYSSVADLTRWKSDANLTKRRPGFKIVRLFQDEAKGTLAYLGYDTGNPEDLIGGPAITLAFRGTVCMANWVTNLNAKARSRLTFEGANLVTQISNLASWKAAQGDTSIIDKNAVADTDPTTETDAHFQFPSWTKGAFTHEGFASAYHSVKHDILDELFALAKKFPDLPIRITGHSLGGALATFAALDLCLQGHILSLQGLRYANSVTLVTFGQPRCGDAKVAELVHSLVPCAARVVLGSDIVTHVPLRKMKFVHWGPEVWIRNDTRALEPTLLTSPDVRVTRAGKLVEAAAPSEALNTEGNDSTVADDDPSKSRLAESAREQQLSAYSQDHLAVCEKRKKSESMEPSPQQHGEVATTATTTAAETTAAAEAVAAKAAEAEATRTVASLSLSKEERRNHVFAKTSFTKPMSCRHCGDLIWSWAYVSGYQCTECESFPLHGPCLRNERAHGYDICTFTASGENPLGSSNVSSKRWSVADHGAYWDARVSSAFGRETKAEPVSLKEEFHRMGRIVKDTGEIGVGLLGELCKGQGTKQSCADIEKPD